jgi:hypothetical protein
MQDNPTSAYVTRTGVPIVATGFDGVFEAFTCSRDWTLAAETRVWMAGRVGSIAERLGLQEMRRVKKASLYVEDPLLTFLLLA